MSEMMELNGSNEKPEIASCRATTLVIVSSPAAPLISPELLGFAALWMSDILGCPIDLSKGSL